LFGDPSRISMLDVLLDGREHMLSGLAGVAGIALSTAGEHVEQLERGGIVVSEREGRRRLVRLAGPDVATALEALTNFASDVQVNGLKAWNRRKDLRAARTCYDHLAGCLGVAIADAAVTAGAVSEDFSLAPRAAEWLEGFGIELDAIPRSRRPLIRTCTGWTERREHLAGSLGAALCSVVLDAGWAIRRPASRALLVTPAGEARLRELGVVL
jgi:DNA-binding transcriptional ArsR family regulator